MPAKPFAAPLAALLVMMAITAPVRAEDTYESWVLLTPEFPSTGGGGFVIKGYNPVVTGAICTTPFTAHGPDGTVYANIAEFDAVPAQGGILCTNGRWRAIDGSATGTTPLRVFIKDGIARRSSH